MNINSHATRYAYRRAATLVQAHYRKMRCRREFVEYIERVRRARKAIAGGARRWAEKAKLTRDSLLARIMVLEDLSKDCIEEAYEEEKLEEKCKNAMLSFLYRYRWKRRMRKRRSRRRSLEEDCAVRAQRAARYFLVTRMMARWR